jgi:hypothetical protein
MPIGKKPRKTVFSVVSRAMFFFLLFWNLFNEKEVLEMPVPIQRMRFSYNRRTVEFRLPDPARLRAVHAAKMKAKKPNRLAITAHTIAVSALFKAFPEIRSDARTEIRKAMLAIKQMADQGVSRPIIARMVAAGLTPFLTREQVEYYAVLQRHLEQHLLRAIQ